MPVAAAYSILNLYNKQTDMAALRGKTLDNTLFHETVVMQLPVPERKGRSEKGIEDRDELLIARYVYYKLYHPYMRYEFMIEQIRCIVGFLEPFTISKKLVEHAVSIQQLRQQEPSKKYFRDKYPMIVWD